MSEIPSTPESTLSKREVTQVFKQSLEDASKIASTPEKQQEKDWILNSVKSANDKVKLNRGNSTFENSFTNNETGETFKQKEGIPVEGIIKLLREHAVTLPEDSEERIKIEKELKLLEDNSKSYAELQGITDFDEASKTDPKLRGRLKQEALLISQDSRRTGSMEGDWFLAIEALKNRRELVLPKAKKSLTEPPTAPTEVTRSDGDSGETSETGPRTPDAGTVRDEGGERGPEPEIKLKTAEDLVVHQLMIAGRTEDFAKTAEEVAKAQLHAEINRGHFLNPLNWPRKFALKIAEPYFQAKLTRRARKFMAEHGSSYLKMDLIKNQVDKKGSEENIARYEQAGQAKVEQLTTQYNLEQQGVEKIGRSEFKETSPAETKAILDSIIKPWARGEDSPLKDVSGNPLALKTEQDFYAALKALADSEKANPEFSSLQNLVKESAFASNILNFAESIKKSTSEGKYALEEADKHVQIILAETAWSGNTAFQRNTAENIMKKIQENPVTASLFGNEKAAAAIAAGIIFVSLGAKQTLGKTAAVIGGGLAFGGLVSAITTSKNFKDDRERVLREMEFGVKAKDKDRVRKKFETTSYDIASFAQLKAGGGKELVLKEGETGERISYDLLLEKVRTNTADDRTKELLVRRIAEIEARITVGEQDEKGLVAFDTKETKEQNLAALMKMDAEARSALIKNALEARGSGITDTEKAAIVKSIGDSIASDRGEWKKRLLENVASKDKFADEMRRKDVSKAVIIAVLTGGIVGVGAQQLFSHGREGINTLLVGIPEKIQNLYPHQSAESFLENMARHFGGITKQIRETQPSVSQGIPAPEQMFAGAFGSAIDKDIIKDLYNNGGGEVTAGNYIFAAGPDHYVTIKDLQTGHPIKIDGITDIRLKENGGINLSGNKDNLPDDLKKMFESWGGGKPVSDIEFNQFERVKGLLSTPGQEGTSRIGDIEVHINQDLNPDQTKQLSFKLGDTEVHGFGKLEEGRPVFSFTPEFAENSKIPPDKLQELYNTLTKDGWKIDALKIDGKPGGSVIDQLLTGTPEELRQKGIIETDQFKKDWIYHTHQDLVKKLGFNTHNELTLHLGQYRGFEGNPGTVYVSPELIKGAIQSHIQNVPALPDGVLGEMIDRNNGEVKYENMFAVVDLNDERQIMLPVHKLADGRFGVDLPDQLKSYDAQKGLSLHGIKSIAAAFVEGKDGKLVPPSELLKDGTIPEGSKVHSLASEIFPSDNPVTPPEPPKIITHLTPPPDSTEFTPPYKVVPPPPPPPPPPTPPEGGPPPPFVPIPGRRRRPPEEGQVPVEPPPPTPTPEPTPTPYGYGYGEGGVGPRPEIELPPEADDVLGPAESIIKPDGSVLLVEKPTRTRPSSSSTTPEAVDTTITRPTNELERGADNIYQRYFGNNWRQKLADSLLIDLRAATPEEVAAESAKGPVGLVATNAEVDSDNGIVRNHIRIFSEGGIDDFNLRTEIGEAVWNLLESAAVTGKLPKAGAFEALLSGLSTNEVANFCKELLDRWDSAYTTRPTRYSGLTGLPREYKNIPEWKSEGFADGIAVQIKRNLGQPLDAREQEVWDSFTPEAQRLIENIGSILLPKRGDSYKDPASSTPETTSTIPTDEVTPPESLESSPVEKSRLLELYLADEDLSPIENSEKREAIIRARRFAQSPALKNAADNNGLRMENAANYYRGMIDWINGNNLTDLEKNDPTIEEDLMAPILRAIYLNNGDIPEDDSVDPVVQNNYQRQANIIAKFIKAGKAPEFYSGNRDLNAFALANLYEEVKDLKFK